MSVPAYTRTWNQKLTTGTPGARITFVSLIDTMQNYMFGVKTFLLANGWSVLWSASAGTGPANSADHTDRIASAATFSPRATIAGASQGWFVLTDGNGGQLLVTYQGASDDICRISYSPGALFTLAGTTNQQPTATDENIIMATVTVVGATASADRVWHGWATSDGKNARFTIFRSSAIVGPSWGVEMFTLPTLPGNVTFTPSTGVWCFCVSPAQIVSAALTGMFATFSANTQGGLTRATISSVGFAVQCGFNTWTFIGNSAPSGLTSQAELQGAAGFIPWPLILMSNTASAKGYVGSLIDQYACAPSGFAVGDGFGTAYDWVQVGVLLWPNPSVTAPTIA